IDNVLKREYGSGGSPALDGERTILTIDLTKTGVKRPAPSASTLTPVSTSSSTWASSGNSSTQAPSGPPPAKSRRKAHKPQRINHCLEETDCADGMDLTGAPTNSSSTK
ncbi:hypothetical protein EGW08_001901, partial [Elysia chlorotica]